jgi:anaerobic magnesium-protoporphyrin IX monomethyl ester cyclase
MKILLVVYDNDSYIHWFPLGLAYIAAVLDREGYEIEVYNQDIHHYPDEHLTEYLNQNHFDIICVSVIAGYHQYRKLLTISTAINNSKNRPLYIMGGHGPSPEPDYFLRNTNADIAVIGEGEETIVELMQAITDKNTLSTVHGIAYIDGDKTIVTPRRKLIKDIDTIPFPAYDMFPIEYYRLIRMPHCNNQDFVMPLLSGRGCTFRCNFCYRLDKGFRGRSKESIIEEIAFLKKEYGINYVAFGDELLMSSKERTTELCEAIIKADLGIKWNCNGRLNYAVPEVLDIMKRSGCVFINYGIEAMDDQILRNMKKGLRTSQVIKGIKATLSAGISPGYNIIFGNIGESKDTLNKGVEFLLEYDDGSQMRTIRPVTPYPGSPLYYYAIEQGMLKDCADFYENKHTNSDLLAINFTNMTDGEFHRALYDANSKLIKNYFANKCKQVLAQAENLYLESNSEFRGFRQS